MKRLLLFFSLFLVLFIQSVYSQTYMDYVSKVSGDTLFVKDDFELGTIDGLYQLITADTLTNSDARVYVLYDDGFYSIGATAPVTSSLYKTVIMGENGKSLKIRDANDSYPPIFCGAVAEGVDATPGLNSGKDALIKNIAISIGNVSGSMGWGCLGTQSSSLRLEVDNCIFEHTKWISVGSNANQKTYIKNSYFVNLSGYSCRRNGGVMDFFANIDTIVVENCTHVMCQGMLYKARSGYTVNRWVFNHNNFINCPNLFFMNRGELSNVSLTNNMFVNSNVLAVTGSSVIDADENDPGGLAIGLVNVYPESANFATNGGKYYVDKNLIYWDPTFDDYISTLNANGTNVCTNWLSQMITMNSRTQAAFDDDATYPYLVEGEWIEGKLPNFANTADLFTTQLAVEKTFALTVVDTTSTIQSMADWRQAGNDASTYFVYADFPLPIDLSYDDADLLTAGIGSFPIGDLSWFPSQYSNWLAQRDAEYTKIGEALNSGTLIDGVEQIEGLPVSYQLEQNFPNPFNPTTVINYTIPKAGNVSLKVYNVIGQEVATLFNGYQEASKYQVSFNASNLASGIYIYTINAGSFTQSKKMMLIK
jgi:hypothetical protein